MALAKQSDLRIRESFSYVKSILKLIRKSHISGKGKFDEEWKYHEQSAFNVYSQCYIQKFTKETYIFFSYFYSLLLTLVYLEIKNNQECKKRQNSSTRNYFLD